MNNQAQDKKYVCAACGSESSETAGSCCGEPRKEKIAAGQAGQTSSHDHQAGNSCGCGC